MVIELSPLDGRIHKWDKLVDRKCPFCGSKGKTRFKRPDNLFVRYCKKCGCYFVSPAPTEKELKRFYKEYYSKHTGCGLPKGLDIWKMKQSKPTNDFKICEVLSILGDVGGMRVLDVGCGFGKDLLMFKKLGAVVEGIDLDGDAMKFTRQELNLDVELKTIEEVGDNNRYMIILMNDLIEHPLNPLSILNKAERLLLPGGLIVILTPNASFINDEPVLFRVDLDHMQYLSFKTCHSIAKKLGLEVIHLESIGFPSLTGMFLNANLKKLIRRLPFFSLFNSIRLRFTPKKNTRLGSYHLFCILRKGDCV